MGQDSGILLKMIGTQAMLFIYMTVGIIVRKANIITDKARGSYNLFLIYVALPALILTSFLHGITAEQLADGGVIMAPK